MRGVKFIVMAVVLLTATVTAAAVNNPYRNWRAINLGAGMLMPKDAATGWQLHLSQTRLMDNAIGYGGGVDLYLANYSDETAIQSLSGPTGTFTVYQTNAEYDLLMFTPHAMLYGTLGSPAQTFQPWAKGTGGLNFLFSNESVNNDSIHTSDSRLYFGVNFTLCAGVNMRLGDYTSLTGFLGYSWGTPKRGTTQNAGLPLTEEINMSGWKLGLILTYKYQK